MKKIVSFLAAAALAAGMLTGCGQTGESDWKYVQDKGTLKIGITLFDPMNYYDPQDPQKLIGFDTELAEAVWLLLTNQFITGVCLPVDGGRSVYGPTESD